MIKTNMFRMYDGRTFEKITKIDYTSDKNLFRYNDFQIFDE